MTPGEKRFWGIAEALLTDSAVSRSTMMGVPCLRVHGAFFAGFDLRTGDLLVKLPAARVDELISAGRAHHFAPSGRPFSEWAAIPGDRSRTWRRLVNDALSHVAS